MAESSLPEIMLLMDQVAHLSSVEWKLFQNELMLNIDTQHQPSTMPGTQEALSKYTLSE